MARRSDDRDRENLRGPARGPRSDRPDAAAGGETVIRKYPNRRLYDASRNDHVTLADLADRVAQGERIRIIDHQTGEDLTAVIMGQVLVESLKDRPDLLPLDLVLMMIRARNQVIRDFLTNGLPQAFHWYLEAQRRMMSGAGWLPPMPGSFPGGLPGMGSLPGGNPAFGGWMPMGTIPGFPPMPMVPGTADGRTSSAGSQGTSGPAGPTPAPERPRRAASSSKAGASAHETTDGDRPAPTRADEPDAGGPPKADRGHDAKDDLREEVERLRQELEALRRPPRRRPTR